MKNLRNIINTYFCALKNEIYIDKYVMEKFLDTSEKLNYIPVRPLKSISFIRKFKIGKFIYLLLNFFSLIILPLFFLKKLIKTFYLTISTQKNCIKDYTDVAFVTNKKGEELVRSISKDVKFINLFQENNVAEHITFNFIIKAYFYSLVSLFVGIFHLKPYNYLQNYVAYDWFLICFLSLKLNNNKNLKRIYITQHYDRWAVLFDRVFYNKELILVQHGIINEDIDPPCKLQNVKKIYLLSYKFENTFERIIENKNVSFKILKYKIDLKEFAFLKDAKSVLIIGQPHSINKEVEIMKKLSKVCKHKNLKILLKPHPLYGLEGYNTSDLKDIIIINEFNTFPKVDVAVSYESTLGLEYENAGIKVLWIKEMDVDEIISNICSIIDN